MKRITLSEEQAKQIYQDYLQDLSLDKLGDKYQISRHVLSRELKRYNFDITRRKYQVNESFFDKIDSEEKAYWLGFLAADGCNESSHHTITINLNERDTKHLDKFRKALGSEAEIFSVVGTGYGEGTTLARIVINSIHLCEALTKQGVPPRKSNILQPPNISPDLYKHWIRGYLDGDGSIYISDDTARIAFVGTKEVLDFIINFFIPGQERAFMLGTRKKIKIIFNSLSVAIQVLSNIYTKYTMTQQYIWTENIKKFQKFTVVLRSNSQNYKRDNCWKTLRASITIV